MASVKFVGVSCSLSGIIDYITNREKTTDRLITGVNCVAQSALHEFETVKKKFHKTDGRSYYHIVQAFSPDDELDFDTAHEIGLKFAQQFVGYQCVVATHMNTRHIHNHIVMNSVNYETGKKFHQTARELKQVKDYSNELCMQYGLSVTESKADPFHIPAWKKKLQKDIREAMENSATKKEFIDYMEWLGYSVDWQSDTKYITYTTPNNLKCRDKKLFDQTLRRENMELYFFPRLMMRSVVWLLSSMRWLSVTMTASTWRPSITVKKRSNASFVTAVRLTAQSSTPSMTMMRKKSINSTMVSE